MLHTNKARLVLEVIYGLKANEKPIMTILDVRDVSAYIGIFLVNKGKESVTKVVEDMDTETIVCRVSHRVVRINVVSDRLKASVVPVHKDRNSGM